MFVYDDNALTKDDLTKLLKLISKDKLKFAFSAHAVKVGDKGYHFVNEPLDRKGKRNKHYAFFKSILVSIVKKHNLKLKKIHRMAMNITFNNGFIKEVPLHTDHDFPHKQIILYLNDSTGTTDIPFYKKSIKPKENSAIIFDDKDHKHYFPDYGVRVVCIFTFS
tara:strand:- start:76 stop:567 length:492 start_codon:yes stop_codon:yes gene_type:complete